MLNSDLIFKHYIHEIRSRTTFLSITTFLWLLGAIFIDHKTWYKSCFTLRVHCPIIIVKGHDNQISVINKAVNLLHYLKNRKYGLNNRENEEYNCSNRSNNLPRRTTIITSQSCLHLVPRIFTIAI